MLRDKEKFGLVEENTSPSIWSAEVAEAAEQTISSASPCDQSNPALHPSVP